MVSWEAVDERAVVKALSEKLLSGQSRNWPVVPQYLKIRYPHDPALQVLASAFDPSSDLPVRAVFEEKHLGRRRNGATQEQRIAAHKVVRELHGAKVSRHLLDRLCSEVRTLMLQYTPSGTTVVFHLCDAGTGRHAFDLHPGHVIDQDLAFEIVALGFRKSKSTISGWYYKVERHTF
jgi:hypothetical protein